MKFKIKFRWILVAVLFLTSVAIWTAVFAITPDGILRVDFLDVGQGDSILITAPNKNQILIDGGPGRSVLPALGEVMSFFDRSIDVVIESHPDADHIGGLPDVFDRFKIGAFVEPAMVGETGIYRALKEKVSVEGSPDLIARKGTKIILDLGVELEVLSAGDGSERDTNEASIVTRLVYGDSEFLFIGDAPVSIENSLAFDSPEKIRADVLKVGHHGSKTSSSEFFLRTVKPELSIISVGEKNRYGHPSAEVIERLDRLKIKTEMTKDEGTITVTSDGRSIDTRK